MKSLLLFLLFTLFLSGCSLEFKKQLKAVEEILIANGKNPKLARAISRTIDNKNVYSIGLRNDSLRVIPDAIGRLHNIRYLNLNFNRIEEISEEIGKCTALVMIELVGNRLKRLPESIGNLRNLEILELRANQLEYLPESIGKLQKLKTLTLQRNQLKELPESFGDLQIAEAWLNENQLETLPVSFSNLRVYDVHLYHNKIKSFPFDALTPKNKLTVYRIGLKDNPLDLNTIPPILREHCSSWKVGAVSVGRDKDSILWVCNVKLNRTSF